MSTTKRPPRRARSRTATTATGPRADDPALVEGVLFALTRTTPERALAATAKKLVATDGRLTTQLERMPGSRWFLVRMRKGATPADAFDAARALQRQRGVRVAEPALLQPGITLDPAAFPELARELRAARPRTPTRKGRTARAFAAGLDPALDCEWSLKLARVLDHNGAPGAWSASTSRGAGVVIGHPDTGYTFHRELWSQRLRWREGWNYVEMNADPLDPLTKGLLKHPGHGTAIGSVIMSDAGDPPSGELPVEPEALESGRARRRTGFVSGSAPAASLVPLRVHESVMHLTSFARLVKALTFATVRGHHVVSMSLGGPWPSAALNEAIDDAVKKGTILVAAAGNVWPYVVYPAAHPKVVSLGACNARRTLWKDSATGPRVDVSAPGEQVWAARVRRVGDALKQEVGPGNGTSFATATTAGIAALWLAHHGVDRLRRTFGADLAGVFRVLLQDTAQTPPGWNTTGWGAGIVDAHALLRAPLDDVERLTRRARRLSAQAAPRWSFAGLFPALTPRQLEAGVRALGRSRHARARLARDPLLARELHWLLLHDDAARAAVRSAATATTRGGVRAFAARGLPPASKARVSPALQRVLR